MSKYIKKSTQFYSELFSYERLKEYMSIEMTTAKTIAVFAIIFGCFAVLYPKIFHPMLLHLFGASPEKKTNDDIRKLLSLFGRKQLRHGGEMSGIHLVYILLSAVKLTGELDRYYFANIRLLMRYFCWRDIIKHSLYGDKFITIYFCWKSFRPRQWEHAPESWLCILSSS